MKRVFAIVDAGGNVLSIQRLDEPPSLPYVELPQDTPKGWPKAPASGLTLRAVAGQLQWVDTQPLASTRSVRLAELLPQYQAELTGDITTQHGVLPGDDATRDFLSRSLLAVNSLPGNPTTPVDMADGSVLNANPAQLKDLVQAFRQREISARARLRSVKAALAAATTREQVAAVSWPA